MATRSEPSQRVIEITGVIKAVSTGESDDVAALAASADFALRALALSLADDLIRRMAIAARFISADDAEDAVATLGLISLDGMRDFRIGGGIVQRGIAGDRVFRNDSESTLLTLEWANGFVRLSVTGAEFETGSLKTIINVVIVGVLVPVTLFAAAPPIQRAYDDHYKNIQISHVVADARCRTEIGFEPDVALLRKLSAEQLDPKEEGIDASTAAIRTCTLQFSLRTVGQSPGRIDGILGPDTLAAMKRFQKEQGLEKHQLFSLVVRDTLAQEAAKAFN